MKKFLELSSWSRKAAIGSMLIVAFAVVGCDDSSSASAGANDDDSISESSNYKATTSSLTDVRDGKTYKIVTIGDKVWMAENLNYAYLQSTADDDSSSFCFGGVASNCDEYGRLYMWSAAMDSAGIWTANGKGCGLGVTCLPTYPVRGVCPSGWHLPDTTEWNSLIFAVGGSDVAGKMLKSATGWYNHFNGTDVYNFAALPAGLWHVYAGYGGEGNVANFWSSVEETDALFAIGVSLVYDSESVSLHGPNKSYAYSVRCVKD